MANFFKIINVTGSLPKRHPKKNLTLDIKYAHNFKSEVKKLAVGAEMFITCDRLPMNIQKLNLEKLIVVNRVTQNEMKRTERKSKPKAEVTVIEEKPVEKPKRQYRTKKSTTTKKKSSTKKSEE